MFAGDYKKEHCNAGNLACTFGFEPAIGTMTPQSGTVFCSLADNFRFSGLCRVPTLRIVTNFYPHVGSSSFSIGQYIRFTALGGAADIELTQGFLNQCIPASTLPATGGGALVSFVVPSSAVSDNVVRALGYAIEYNGQPRNVGSGVTDVKDFNNTNADGQPFVEVLPGTVNISSTPRAEKVNLGQRLVATFSGTSYSFVDQWNLPNQVGSAATATSANWFSTVFRGYVSTATGYTYAEQSSFVTNTGSTTISVDMSDTYTTNGYTLQRFSNGDIPNSVPCQGFGAPAFELVEKKEKVVRLRVPEMKTKGKQKIVVQSAKVIEDKPTAVTTGGKSTGPKAVSIYTPAPTLNEMMMKDTLIGSITMNTTNAAGSVIGSYEAPFQLLNANRMLSVPAQRYVFGKMDVVLKAQVQSNMFQCGSLLVVWAPMMNTAQAMSVYNNNLQSCFVTRHAMLVCGRNQSVELEVPFVHPSNYLDLRSGGDFNIMGTFLFVVLTPLRVGPSATSLNTTITVSAHFPNSEFAVLNPTGVSIVPQGNTMIRQSKNTFNISNSAGATVDNADGHDSFEGKAEATVTPADTPNLGLNAPPVQSRV